MSFYIMHFTRYSIVFTIIANVWAMVNYPDSWKDFFYYMLVAEGKETGMDRLYSKFISFLADEVSKLKKQGCLKQKG